MEEGHPREASAGDLALGIYLEASAGRDVYQAGRDLHSELHVHVHSGSRDVAIPEATGTAASNEVMGSVEIITDATESAAALTGLISGLNRMLQKLSAQVRSLTAERDSLQADLRSKAGLSAELEETRESLQDTSQRLTAAISAQQDLEGRLSEAERQRTEAERLKAVAEENLERARNRFAEFEQGVPRATEHVSSARGVREPEPVMGGADQQAVSMVLGYADRLLHEQAGNLRRLRGSVGEPRHPRAPFAATARAPVPSSTAVRLAGRVENRSTVPGMRVAGNESPPVYREPLPDAVKMAYFTSARFPISRMEPFYKDIARPFGIGWELLAACDWMQCQSNRRLSPVFGEPLGKRNIDGTVYATKPEALAQCATDLIELARAVYSIDLTRSRPMSVRELADVFAAFRWGRLLRKHCVSSLEFPYSVEGLTKEHVKMRWPVINESKAPDKPGARFRMPFGAVPVVLSLNYQATA